jgi:ribosomal protein L7/L12
MPEQGEQIRVLADAPSKVDFLGFGASVGALKKIIVSPHTVTPFTIGVFGDWGTGKSTLMMQLASALQEDGVATVFFNPWKYEGKEEVWKALIQTILLTFEEREKADAERSQIQHMLLGLARTAASNVVKHATAGLIDLDKFLDDYAKISKDNLRFINQFETNFTRLVKKYSDNNNLVIFIDDLDRCVPENAISVLEAIKLFLSVPKCVYVIGVERAIIQDGIRQRYGDKINFSGKDYLEKIIQLPFSLPVPSESNVSQFVQILAGQSIPEDVRRVAIAGSEANPRRIKRFINSFNLLRAIRDEEGAEALNETVLTFVLMMQIRFPDQYLHFASHLADFTELVRRVSAVQLFTAEDLQALTQSSPRYALLLQEPAFAAYLESVGRLRPAIGIGDEGASAYFVATRVISIAPSAPQAYYLPEVGADTPPTREGYAVRLTQAGDKKINVIKELRAIRPDLGLKEAKDMAEGTPQIVVSGVPQEAGIDIIRKLEAAGATAELV